MAVDQIVRYADVGGRTVAWSEVGSGPALIIGGWWCSHVRADWQDERFRHFTLTLARNHRVIRYDPPGSGLSGRDVECRGRGTRRRPFSWASPRPSDLTPSRCSEQLGLGGGDGDGGRRRGPGRQAGDLRRLPHGADMASPAAQAAMLDLVRRHWGLGSRMLADVFMPGATADERAAFARYQRRVASSDEAAGELPGCMPTTRVTC